MVGGQTAPRLLHEELELHRPFENQLGADELALPAQGDRPAGQQLGRLPRSAVEAHLVGEGEGLLLDGGELIGLPLGDLLLDPVGLRLQHPLAAHLLPGLEGGQVHRQVGPQQHLPGVQRPGLRPPQADAGLHRSPVREAGGLQLGGEGQGRLHAAQPSPRLGLVKDHRPHRPAGLGHPLFGLLTVEGRLSAHRHDA